MSDLDRNKQITKKYVTRNSPPFKANAYCGERKKGNDGFLYISKINSKGICQWKKIVKAGKPLSKKNNKMIKYGGDPTDNLTVQNVNENTENTKFWAKPKQPIQTETQPIVNEQTQTQIKVDIDDEYQGAFKNFCEKNKKALKILGEDPIHIFVKYYQQSRDSRLYRDLNKVTLLSVINHSKFLLRQHMDISTNEIQEDDIFKITAYLDNTDDITLRYIRCADPEVYNIYKAYNIAMSLQIS
jgi:hypothetical protein